MRNVTAPLAALIFVVYGCSEEGTSRIPWPGSVEAELDNLTGARTGMFRTYGPAQLLTAGPESIPVTLGYWCHMDEDSEPATATDGLFFKVAMPDTSLVSDDEEAFEELSGQLGLLDVARMAVDGRVYAWEYWPMPTYGGWFLDGDMGFRSFPLVDTPEKRGGLLQSLTEGYERSRSHELARMGRDVRPALDAVLREGWSPAHDYVVSHYVGRDTLGIELKGVLKFSMEGFDAAIDSVRFWCPLKQSHDEWNALRVEFFRALDSLRMASQEPAVGKR